MTPSKSRPSSELEAEVARQIAEGLLPSTVERRLIRQGHPEDEVKRLVDAARSRIEDRRAKARAQALVNSAKGFGLLLVVAGIFLSWSSVSQIDPFQGALVTTSLNGFSPQYLVYGLGLLIFCAVLLVLMLFTRTHYDPTNRRDRTIFIMTMVFAGLLAIMWAAAFSAVNRDLDAARADIALVETQMAAFGIEDVGSSAGFGAGIFAIPVGVVILLATGYFEIAAVGGPLRLSFRGDDESGDEEETPA